MHVIVPNRNTVREGQPHGADQQNMNLQYRMPRNSYYQDLQMSKQMPSDRESYKRISLAQRSSLQNPSEHFKFIEGELLLDQFKNQVAKNYRDDEFYGREPKTAGVHERGEEAPGSPLLPPAKLSLTKSNSFFGLFKKKKSIKHDTNKSR